MAFGLQGPPGTCSHKCDIRTTEESIEFDDSISRRGLHHLRMRLRRSATGGPERSHRPGGRPPGRTDRSQHRHDGFAVPRRVGHGHSRGWRVNLSRTGSAEGPRPDLRRFSPFGGCNHDGRMIYYDCRQDRFRGKTFGRRSRSRSGERISCRNERKAAGKPPIPLRQHGRAY